MKWALVDTSGIVQNVIAYDGISEYTPDSAVALEQVNNWINIGDNKNAPEPIITGE